jgi:hypothetical protein
MRCSSCGRIATPDGAIGNAVVRGGRWRFSEERGFGAGQPDLAAAIVQPFEQRSAAARIEVRGDFIEEQDGAATGLFRDEIGVGEDDAEEEGFLFAGRALRGGLLLAQVGDASVLTMGADQRATGGSVSRARGGEVGRQVAAIPSRE